MQHRYLTAFCVLFLITLIGSAPTHSEQLEEEPVLSAGVYLIESVKTKTFLTVNTESASAPSGVKKVKTLSGGTLQQQKWVVIPIGQGQSKGKNFMVINELYPQQNTVSTLAIGASKKLTRSWQIIPVGDNEDRSWQMLDLHFESCLSSGSRNGEDVTLTSKCVKGEKEQQWRFKLIRKLEPVGPPKTSLK